MICRYSFSQRVCMVRVIYTAPIGCAMVYDFHPTLLEPLDDFRPQGSRRMVICQVNPHASKFPFTWRCAVHNKM